MMTFEKVKVLYIAGMGRSGSTILGRLLGELPDAVHVGELGLFSSPQFQNRAYCECQRSVASCDFWKAVFERAFGGVESLDLKTLEETRQQYRLRALPQLLLPKTPAQAQHIQDYQDVLSALYRAVRDISGAKVIIDGSKEALYGFLLNQSSGVDLHMVHLIRDSRAVAFSHQRVKKYSPMLPDTNHLPRLAPWQTALYWNGVTLLLRAMRKPSPLLLRYEDFAGDPQETLARLWSFVGEPVPSLDFLKAAPLYLHQGHTVAGNPDRFQSKVVLKPDLEWQSKMRPADRRQVTALTFPLLLRYGYLRPQPSKKVSRQIQSARVL